jgi:hypothetical protein
MSSAQLARWVEYFSIEARRNALCGERLGSGEAAVEEIKEHERELVFIIFKVVGFDEERVPDWLDNYRYSTGSGGKPKKLKVALETAAKKANKAAAKGKMVVGEGEAKAKAKATPRIRGKSKKRKAEKQSSSDEEKPSWEASPPVSKRARCSRGLS